MSSSRPLPPPMGPNGPTISPRTPQYSSKVQLWNTKSSNPIKIGVSATVQKGLDPLVDRIQKVPIFSQFELLTHFVHFRSLKVRPALSFCHLMSNAKFMYRYINLAFDDIKWQKGNAGIPLNGPDALNRYFGGITVNWRFTTLYVHSNHHWFYYRLSLVLWVWE